MGLTSACFKQKFLFQERRTDWWLGKHSWHTWAMPRAGHNPGLRGTLCEFFMSVCVSPPERSFFPPRRPLPPLLHFGPWGSFQSAEPCLTEAQRPYKSHPPIYLMCSSTRTPSIRPRGACISKHSNSLDVQISSGPELYSQIPKSLRSVALFCFKTHLLSKTWKHAT